MSIYFNNRHYDGDQFYYEIVDDGEEPSKKYEYQIPDNERTRFGIKIIEQFRPVHIEFKVPVEYLTDMEIMNKYLMERYCLEIGGTDELEPDEEGREPDDPDYEDPNRESDEYGMLFYNSDLRSMSGEAENFDAYDLDKNMNWIIDNEFWLRGCEDNFLQLCDDADKVEFFS